MPCPCQPTPTKVKSIALYGNQEESVTYSMTIALTLEVGKQYNYGTTTRRHRMSSVLAMIGTLEVTWRTDAFSTRHEVNLAMYSANSSHELIATN